jgi:LmbE family N-acetylglucosaminyl deacetylase
MPTPGAAPAVELPGFRRILVIAAHPDDVEFWCGGTLARYVAAGARVDLVLCTSGDRGSAEPHILPARLAAIREAEQAEAAALLGLSSVTFLRHPDGGLAESPALRGDLVRQIRRHQPELLITHDPVNPYPPYTAHRDHRTTGRVVLDAAYPDARDWHYFPEQISFEGLRPHITPNVWLMATTAPTLYVDVSPTLALKIDARLAHHSQTSNPTALRESWPRRAADIGAPAGLAAAEAFVTLQM